MPWAVAAAVVGGVVASNTAKKQTKAAQEMNDKQIEANEKLPQNDPRIAQMLYGDGTQRLRDGVTPTWSEPDEYGAQTSTNSQFDYQQNTGLLGQYTDAMKKPQDWALGNYANNARNYITDNAGDMGKIRDGALQQMQGIQAPTFKTPTDAPMAERTKIDMEGLLGSLAGGASVKKSGPVGAATVNSPAHGKMDLSQSFKDLIDGPLGANPYLTDKINGDMAQSKNYFDQMQFDSSKNMKENVLPSIRGGAIASGQYGGSRQGIAEGRALGDLATEQQRAITMFGQNNTNAAAAARSAAYESDSNRKLSATQTLSGQQYGAAMTDASNAQSAANQTASNALAENMLNAQLAHQRYMSGADKSTQAYLEQARMDQNTSFANQNALLGIGNNNLQAQLGTNTLNSQNLQNGMANLGGLMNSNFGTAAAQDQYDLTKMGNGLGVLAPYLAKNATPAQLQPVYNNSGAAALGGALAGAQIGGNLYNSFGGSGTGNPTAKGGMNGYGTGAAAGGGGTFYDGYGWGS